MAETVRLKNARIAISATHSERVDVVTDQGGKDNALEIDLKGHLLLPGLINAHDHLEFNLFPRLGRGPYANAYSWAGDIHRPCDSPVRENLLVPKKCRLAWGGIKNLLSGVTTVVHHNPFEPSVFNRQFPVRVVNRFGWAHSLDFSPDICESWKNTPVRWPFIVHAAEGTDEKARGEVSRLKELGVLDRRTVLVHAVGATNRDFKTIAQSGSSIVWCPTANLFTLGRTLSPETLRSGIPIALGTDSAITGEGDLIDEMKRAKTAGSLNDAELYRLVTTDAARILRLSTGQGVISLRGVADIVAVEDVGQTPAEALQDLNPQMVMVRGRVMLMSDRFSANHGCTDFSGFNPIHLEGRGSWLIRANVPELHAIASAALGPELRLAGKRVSP
jgi:cytosine/adenosine deaminase-related metal-dependent hydrolase